MPGAPPPLGLTASVEETSGHWSRVQERGSALGLRFTVACYRLFGWWLSLPLVYAVVTYFFLTDRRGRAASRDYLERLHAHLSKEATPRWRPTTRESFLHYCEFAVAIADRVALWSGRLDAFEFRFHGREHLDAAAAGRRGSLFYGAHLGSFDALRGLASVDQAPVNVLMHTRHAPKINEVLRSLSPDAELRVLSPAPDAASTALAIRACIEKGEHVAILGDRTEAPDRQRVRQVDFLGSPAPFPEAPFQLPSILGCTALMLVALRRGPRRYDVHVEVLAESGPPAARSERQSKARDLLESYVARLERYCAIAPRQWFNFYDFWSGTA